MRSVVVLLTSLALACDTTVDVEPLPNDCVAGPEMVPNGCGLHPALTAATVPEWLGAYLCSGSDQFPNEQAQVDAARGDAATLDAFFAIVDATWTFDGVSASCTNASDTWATLSVIGALRDPNAFARLDALVWRPLPTPTFQLEADEYRAAEALACIATPEAQLEAQNIAANHPSHLVRELTAGKLADQKCGVGDIR